MRRHRHNQFLSDKVEKGKTLKFLIRIPLNIEDLILEFYKRKQSVI